MVTGGGSLLLTDMKMVYLTPVCCSIYSHVRSYSIARKILLGLRFQSECLNTFNISWDSPLHCSISFAFVATFHRHGTKATDPGTCTAVFV